MKALSCTVLGIAMLFSVPVLSQIVIDDSHINVPGVTLQRYLDTSSTINPGSSGSGQNWSFNLKKDEANSVSFLNPSPLPRSSVFPTSNLALTFDFDNDSSWAFLEISDTAFWVLGFSSVYEVDAVGDTVAEPYLTKILSFPSSVGTKFNSTVTTENKERFNIDPDGPGPHPSVDSIKTTFTIMGESEIDAEGSLTIETCLYSAIRQFYSEVTVDSTSMYSNGSWQALSTTMINFLGQPATYTDTSHIMRWWVNQKAIGFPIVECTVDKNKNVIGDVEWVSNVCVGIDEFDNENFTVYPNPASRQLKVMTTQKLSQKRYFKLYDLNGKTVFNREIDANEMQLPPLKNGTYMYQITDEFDRVVAVDKLIITQ